MMIERFFALDGRKVHEQVTEYMKEQWNALMNDD